MEFTRKILITISLICVLLLSGCMVSQDKYDGVQSELNQVKSDKASLETEITSLNTDLSAKESELSNLDVESKIKSDYIELYQYLLTASSIEGSLGHQYWQIYNDPDGIYTDVYKDELSQYKAQVSTTKDKLNRLISKMESNSNIEIQGLPEELDTVSELEDLRASLDLAVDTFEEGISDFE